MFVLVQRDRPNLSPVFLSERRNAAYFCPVTLMEAAFNLHIKAGSNTASASDPVSLVEMVPLLLRCTSDRDPNWDFGTFTGYVVQLKSSSVPVHYAFREFRVTEAATKNVNSLNSPGLQHGWLKEGDIVGVCFQVKVVQDFLHSVQQLCWMRYFNPAVFPDVLFCGIGWMNTTEPVGILELLQVILIHNREGSREELAESAEQRVMFRGALP